MNCYICNKGEARGFTFNQAKLCNCKQNPIIHIECLKKVKTCKFCKANLKPEIDFRTRL